MSWLRIDDGFSEHHKIAELTDSEFRVWVRTLCYAARNSTKEGRLTPAARKEIVGFSEAKGRRYVALGLLDTEGAGGVLVVHDWAIYNAESVASKVAYYLERHPAATANEVARALGGTRNIVLAEVAAYRRHNPQAVPIPVPEDVPESGTENGTAVPAKRYGNGSPTGTEIGTRARASRPDPNPYLGP